MKHIVWAVMAAAFIFTGTAGYSRGFSVGVFGAYSIDGGAIEKTINEKTSFGDFGNAASNGIMPKIECDEIIIPGAGLFAGYTFSNGFSIRTGSEFYKMASGGEINKLINNTGISHYEIDYEAIAFPFLLGITVSPDKGKTNIYGYAGIVVSMIEISQNYEWYLTSTPYEIHKYESENGTFVPGFAALLGLEKRIFSGFSVILEYTFYKCESIRIESGDYSCVYNGIYGNEYTYTERYGLPRQQARVGVKYSF